MPTIFYAPDQVVIDVPERQTLLNAALSAGIPHTHVCGGNARCSTCRVVIVEGLEYIDPPNEKEQALARRLDLQPTIRIACQATVRGPVRVRRLVLDQEDVKMLGRLHTSNASVAVGDEMKVAVLFSDIRSFTPFAEALLPYDVIHILNRHFETMGRMISAAGGFINNYMGDGLMALFGVDGQPDAPLRAVRAALDMLHAMGQLKDYTQRMYGRSYDIGIGVHWGEAVVGPVGSEDRKTVTAIGDSVNFASRIETANKDVGSRLLVSEAVFGELKGRAMVGRTATVSVKGKTGEYKLYEITGLIEAPERELLR